MKILTDEAVNSWKYNIHHCILNTCGKFMQLCALHMNRDNPYLLDLLVTVLDPENKFNTFNMSRQSEQFTIASAVAVAEAKNPDVDVAINTTSPETHCSTATVPTEATTSTAAITAPIAPTAATTTGVTATTSSPSPSLSSTDVSNAGKGTPNVSQSDKRNNSSLNSTTNAIESGSSGTNTTALGTKKGSTITGPWGVLQENEMYATSPADPHNPRGWLVDLINR